MAKKSLKTITIPKRRKREAKTNYNKRLSLLKSGRPRLVIRKSNKNMQIQVIGYSQGGDKILVSCHSNELRKMGWKYSKKNIPAAYLTGLLLGSKIKKAGIKDAIADVGLQPSTKGSKLFSALKGVIDAGINVPCSKEILPSDERIKGAHINEYAKKLQGEKQAFEKQFSRYIKHGAEPENMQKAFEELKKNIMKL